MNTAASGLGATCCAHAAARARAWASRTCVFTTVGMPHRAARSHWSRYGQYHTSAPPASGGVHLVSGSGSAAAAGSLRRAVGGGGAASPPAAAAAPCWGCSAVAIGDGTGGADPAGVWEVHLDTAATIPQPVVDRPSESE